jgi:hypothetical protein
VISRDDLLPPRRRIVCYADIGHGFLQSFDLIPSLEAIENSPLATVGVFVSKILSPHSDARIELQRINPHFFASESRLPRGLPGAVELAPESR